ncbi:MAG: UDP-N-acetylglucosamine--N-acetylmuramyl-(pentapeptide) pyrophosphoryl-undecaprenol N-acetylglucosamine transferase [Magnetococcales bacterium]|nr:UDP-N-acetylglucosamine--N-acetylmuramyl-(pentapeptide) pyrophosphoryl-undecaprenol N-acetylglucosamine transferase [Magnetococcales bacterium]
MANNRKKILITGGGTGGHLYPALALARHFRDRLEVVYVGRGDKIEGRVIPEENFPFHSLAAVPFTTSPARLPGFFWHFSRSLLRALRLLLSIRPLLVVGFGGYVSLPVGLMARLLGIPVAVHEQNMHGGLANRILVRVGAQAMTTFPGTKLPPSKRPPIVTGCPVRSDIGSHDKVHARKILELPLDKKICLVIGGSGGAKFINDTLLKVLLLAAHRSDIYFLHVTGPAHLESTRATLSSTLHEDQWRGRYRMEGYISEIALYYAAADLAICRGGSATVNELACAGLPALLVPSPNVTDNHQEGNARYLESLEAAEVLLEGSLTPEILLARIVSLLDDPETRASMAANGRTRALGHQALAKMEEVLQQHCPTLE